MNCLYFGLALACCLLLTTNSVDAEKPLGLNSEKLNGDGQQQQNPQIYNPMKQPRPLTQPLESSGSIFPIPEEDVEIEHKIQVRAAQGEGYANYQYQQQSQPYSIGRQPQNQDQRFFLPLPGWGWTLRPPTNNREKPGSCYRPNQFGSGGGYSGGNFGNGYSYDGIDAKGQQGGNRPITKPTTTPAPYRCRADYECPGNKKCCYGKCATPSFVG